MLISSRTSSAGSVFWKRLICPNTPGRPELRCLRGALFHSKCCRRGQKASSGKLEEIACRCWEIALPKLFDHRCFRGCSFESVYSIFEQDTAGFFSYTSVPLEFEQELVDFSGKSAWQLGSCDACVTENISSTATFTDCQVFAVALCMYQPVAGCVSSQRTLFLEGFF